MTFTSKLGTVDSALGRMVLGIAPGEAAPITTGLNAWSRALGTRQGRIIPAGWSASDGSHVFVLGSDTAGDIADLHVSDYASIAQIAEIAAGTKVLRTVTRLRGPSTMVVGLSWRFSLLIDDVELAFVELKTGKTFDKVDLAANVSKMSGTHKVELRVTLYRAASSMVLDLFASSPTMSASAGGTGHIVGALSAAPPTASAHIVSVDHLAMSATVTPPTILGLVSLLIPLFDIDFTNHSIFPVGTMSNAAFYAATGITHTGTTDPTIVAGGLTIHGGGTDDVWKVLAADTAKLIDAGRISLEFGITATTFWSNQVFWQSQDGQNQGSHGLTSLLTGITTGDSQNVPAGGGGFGPHRFSPSR